MGALGLSIQVLNISLEATKEDLIMFFSYCGTIDEIQLQRDGDQSQLAILTFKQPYAFHTALLLNDAVIVDQRVRILPLENGTIPIVSCTSENNKGARGFIPATQPVASAEPSPRERIILNNADKGASGTGRELLARQGKPAVCAAEQSVGTAISSSCWFSKSTQWLSDAVDRASRGVSVLGNGRPPRSNSRKIN